MFTKMHSGEGGYHHEAFHDDDHVIGVLTKILDDAGRSHRNLDPAEGLQDAQLDGGARLPDRPLRRRAGRSTPKRNLCRSPQGFLRGIKSCSGALFGLLGRLGLG
jgi:hypothetical protein